ncbi:hypothetical protein IT571_04795, partial [Candidatus Sumerlaeota bacterium]|nr:hypothetical protein [Candidatus Sumerlaeota bacterium]
TVSDDRTQIDIRGVFQVRKQLLPTPFKQVLFRLFMITVGRFNANAVRATLQKILIVQKAPLKIHFRRHIALTPDGITITDEIVNREEVRFRRLSWPTDATSIYVANSNVFQESTLHPWQQVSDADVARLNSAGKVRITRKFSASPS